MLSTYRIFLLAILIVGALAQCTGKNCATCDSASQNCLTCPDGYRFADGRCHLYQCDRANPHAGIFNSGSPDTRIANWSVISADASTQTVDIAVFVPHRFECNNTGDPIEDAKLWQQWLNTTHCSNATYCGPSSTKWTPVLLLGRDADDSLGYLDLPIAVSTEKECTSASRNGASDYTITSYNNDPTGLVTSWDSVTGEAVIRVSLVAATTPGDDAYCADATGVDATIGFGQVGERYEYWSKNETNGGDHIVWTFDATICYVDSIGQSVCPFSSPFFTLDINLVTENVAISQGGAAELLVAPACNLFIRSAQVRYSGDIGTRTAIGEYEIAVSCEGINYLPNIAEINHCVCEGGSSSCTIFEKEAATCTTGEDPICTTTAMFKSTSFLATDSDFLRSACTADPTLGNGDFVTEISYIDGNCTTDDTCIELTNTKLFGSAPLKATDDAETLAGMDSKNFQVYAGVMLSNDLTPDDINATDFHQFNRAVLVQATVTRIASPDVKNSFVMCAMMQPTTSGPFTPDDLEHIFKITIREVEFIVQWTNTSKPDTIVTLSNLLSGHSQLPSQWVWESQESDAFRREVLGRYGTRAEAPCGSGVCEVTPLQEHLESTAGWNHVQDNIDCVGISPFYLYSLLTLNDVTAVPDSIQANLTVFHEYNGKVTGFEGRRLLEDSNERNLLQQAFYEQRLLPVFAERTSDQKYSGGMQWSQDSDTQDNDDEGSAVPMLPIIIGLAVAGSCCFVFAGFAAWRKRHRTCAQCQKNMALSKFTKDEIKLSGPQARCKDCLATGCFDVTMSMKSTGRDSVMTPSYV